MDVAIINYGINNLYSVHNACTKIGLNSVITDDYDTIMKSKISILPGVGAFSEAMKSIRKKKIDRGIYDFINTGKPFFAICLGMQLLFSESEEFKVTKGLDIIKGNVIKFRSQNDKKMIVPHVGWNQIQFHNKNFTNSVMRNNSENEFMYFVHSYHVVPDCSDIELTSTKYQDIRYCSAILKDNVTAFQFHPEKSGNSGMKIFNSIKELVVEGK